MTDQARTTDSSVNGQAPAPFTSQTIVSRSPATGEVLGQVAVATPSQIQATMAEARLGQVAWEGIGLQRRVAFIAALRDALYRHKDRVLSMLVAEQGKVLQEATLEYLATIETLDYYVREAARVLSPVVVPVRLVPQRRFMIERRPFGVVLLISVWNYPLFFSLGPIAAALIAGNSLLFKPSEFATQVGEVIAGLIDEAGIPGEVFHVLHGYGEVGAALIDARPDRIVFTGSVANGKKVAQAAAEKLIPVTLELGGKDAAIVLDDADIDHAAEGIVWSGMFNAGQTCASVERVFVQRRVAEQLVTAMKRVIVDHVQGSDGAAGQALAAITTPAQLATVDSQVREAIEGGAQVVVGGYRLNGGGMFYAPTILTGVTPDMRICREETFGPVIAVTAVEDEEEAVRRANDSPFGLTASVWTRDRQRGLRLARRLAVGSVSINEHLLVSGVPETPWGGVRESGYGRTKGREGLLEMTYSQTINVDRVRLPVELFWYPYNPLKRALFHRAIDVLYGPTLRDKLRALLP